MIEFVSKVLQHMADGWTNQEIATDLGVSVTYFERRLLPDVYKFVSVPEWVHSQNRRLYAVVQGFRSNYVT